MTIVLTFGPTVRRTARQAIFPVADVKVMSSRSSVLFYLFKSDTGSR